MQKREDINITRDANKWKNVSGMHTQYREIQESEQNINEYKSTKRKSVNYSDTLASESLG